MAAVFRPVDTNVGVVYMGGVTTVELCRINTLNAVVTSSLLPSSWSIQITDNLLKLINWTTPAERTTPEFLRMLMAAIDSSGVASVQLTPSVDSASGLLVVTMSTLSPEDIAILHVPRTSDAGFLLAAGGGGGGGAGVDAFARSRINELQEALDGAASQADIDAAITGLATTTYVDNAVSGKASTTYVDNAVSSKASTTYVDNAVAGLVTDSELSAAIKDYDAKADGGLTRTTASASKYEFSVDGTVPRLANAVTPADHIPALTKALTINSDAEFELTSVADAQALLDALAAIPEYSAKTGGGLERTAVDTDYEFALKPNVMRTASVIGPDTVTELGLSPVLNADGRFDLVEMATKDDLDAVTAGLKYKDAVQKMFTIVPTQAQITGASLAEGDRFLVNNGASAPTNGVYVVTATSPYSARATDFDNEGVSGAYVFDLETGISYVCRNEPGTDVPGTDALAFTVYKSGVTYSAGAGLSLTGSTFAVSFVSTAPAANGTASAGGASTVAKSDHVHPTDTALMPKAPALTDLFTAYPAMTVALSDALATSEPATGSNKLATTKYVQSVVSTKIAAGAVTGVNGSPNIEATTAPGGTVTVSLKGQVPFVNGGTGIGAPDVTSPEGAVLFVPASSANRLGSIKGTLGQVLTQGAANPAWVSTLNIAQGGTGVATLAKGALLMGPATGTAMTPLTVGTSGQVLTIDPTSQVPTWASPATASVTLSTGTTGLTVNGATPSATGTSFTLSGTLSPANGGTGLGGAAPFAPGDILYANSATTLMRLAKPATPAGEVLTFAASATAPSWASTISAAKITAIPYDIALNIPGAVTPEDEATRFIAVRPCTLQASGSTGGPLASCGGFPSAPTGDFTIWKIPAGGGTPAQIGTVSFSVTGVPTISMTLTSLVRGDVLRVLAPVATNSIEDVAITLSAVLT